MAQHKWHKEIKAWADGAEIEMRTTLSNGFQTVWSNEWTWTDNDDVEYRIKPQPQYLYAYYLRGIDEIHWSDYSKQEQDSSLQYIGKIKLEVD